MIYIADTQSLVWFLNSSPRLGKNAALIFSKAEKGEAFIVIPAIVLTEILHICEKKKVLQNFTNIITQLEESLNYVVCDLSLPVVKECESLTRIPEMHDRIIVATARLLHLPILTNDNEIKKSGYAEVIW